MFTDRQLEDLVELLLELNENTKVYIGCDSVRFMKKGRWYAKYATVCIVHMNGNKGCKIFSHKSIEQDYDLKKDRPKMRMMTEVQKVCELYTQIAPLIEPFPIEIHLDINPDPKHGSSVAAKEATGYVLGMTGKEPLLKPDAFAASFGSDHYANGRDTR